MEREAVLRATGENGFDYEAAVFQRYGKAAREVESVCVAGELRPRDC